MKRSSVKMKLKAELIKQVEDQQRCRWDCALKPSHSILYQGSCLLLLQLVLPILEGSETCHGMPSQVLPTQRDLLRCGSCHPARQPCAQQRCCGNSHSPFASQSKALVEQLSILAASCQNSKLLVLHLRHCQQAVHELGNYIQDKMSTVR